MKIEIDKQLAVLKPEKDEAERLESERIACEEEQKQIRLENEKLKIENEKIQEEKEKLEAKIAEDNRLKAEAKNAPDKAKLFIVVEYLNDSVEQISDNFAWELVSECSESILDCAEKL